jgi:hypothetical protein
MIIIYRMSCTIWVSEGRHRGVILTLIFDVGITVSAIFFRREGSSLRQHREEVVMARSDSTLFNMENTKDSAP